jgi:MFS family permease
MIQTLIYFGTWFSVVAINTLLIQFHTSEMMIAVITAAMFLPAIFIAPFSGAVIDRFSTKSLMRLMVLTELSMTLAYLTIDSSDMLWILFILIFIRSSAASMFFTLEMSLLPKIISGETLQEANEIHSMIWSVTYALGMAIGGVVVYYVGIYNSFLIDAALFAIAFYLLLSIHIEVKSDLHEPIAKMIKDGFTYLKNNKHILGLILLHSSVALTAFDALVTLLADFNYKYTIAVALAIGWLNAVRAFALAIGQFIIGKYIHEKNLHILLVLQGIAIIIWGYFQKDFTASLITIFFVGLFTTSLWSYTYSMLQRATQKEYLGRVIAYNDMIFMVLSVATTMFIGTASKNGLSLEWITYILGVCFILVAIWYRRYIFMNRLG